MGRFSDALTKTAISAVPEIPAPLGQPPSASGEGGVLPSASSGTNIAPGPKNPGIQPARPPGPPRGSPVKQKTPSGMKPGAAAAFKAAGLPTVFGGEEGDLPPIHPVSPLEALKRQFPIPRGSINDFLSGGAHALDQHLIRSMVPERVSLHPDISTKELA